MVSVLVVDDDADFLKETEHILTQHAYKVYTALHVEAAEEILNKYAGDISVILLDYALPFINGIEFLKWLKQEKIHIRKFEARLFSVIECEADELQMQKMQLRFANAGKVIVNRI